MDDNVNDLILSLLEDLEKYASKGVEYKFEFDHCNKKYEFNIKLKEVEK